MANRSPRVFTIPASVPFLPALIAGLRDGRLVPGFPADGDDPLRLAAATLYLPTRRACRLAREVFLDEFGGDSAILPRIVPIGDVDEDELGFADADGALGTHALDLPPALGGLERRLLLTQLVAKWAVTPAVRAHAGAPLIASTPAAALALADDLARLIDDMTTRQVAWERLDGFVPDNVDKYWQLTLDFLNFMRGHWSPILEERGAIEPAARRDRLIAAEAARLAHGNGPVIAAGSTGSMPATAALLATIANLAHGALVLPGLDTDLDEASWSLIGGRRNPGADDHLDPASGHPQFAMHGLLRRIGIARDAVAILGTPAGHGRERLVSEALRPAAATDRWQDRIAEPLFAAGLDATTTALTVIEAANAEDEALAIAVALREAVETDGRTAALITPDRSLARRVLAALARWNVPVDDSGGDALTDTPAGRFARLAAETALGGAAPVTLLALLKHPLLRLGAEAGAHRAAIATLERALLRGPRPRPGSAGLAQALAAFRQERPHLHPSDPRASLTEAELDLVATFIDVLEAALEPLERRAPAPQGFAALAAAHRAVIVALSKQEDGRVAGFAGDDGAALADAFDDIAASTPAGSLAVAASDYADLFRAALADRVVRRPEATGVRVRIFGPLEARLQAFDRVVLGGLVEGIWPPETRTDPWLSRPMRHDLGLDLPERRIGLSAHDFAQALGAPEVFLTRAARIAGSPTVASRFVLRLAAVAGDERWRAAVERGARYLALARLLDQPAQAERIARPAPTPPRDARPARLSVTDIENWLRDPYTIYAKHILRLAPLDAVDTPPGAADRGTVIHEAIGEFTKTFAQALPDDPEAVLLTIGARHFAALDAYPEARAFWWPRFRRIAAWFAEWERERRGGIATLHAEIRGEIPLPLGERTFRLSARADRIERRTDGRLAVLDYKTGAGRTEKQVRTGLAPQLTLEAAILRNGGFRDIAAGASVGELAYVEIRGGDPAGEFRAIDFKDGVPDSQADLALARLTELARKFEDEATPYRSLVHPMWRTRYGDYDHLARVKEWSATGGAIENGGGE